MVTDGPAVLILVLSRRSEPFRSLEAAQRATWMSELPPNVRVLHYWATTAPLVTMPTRLLLRLLEWTPRIRTRVLRWFGRRASARSHDGSLKLDMPDVFHLINAKTIGAFRYVAAYESFDYVYRVNSSAYVDVLLLLEWLGSLPRHECYAGSVVRKSSFPYVFGAGIALSRDLVAKCASAEDWNYSVIDDRAIGLFMDHIGVAPSITRIST